MGMCIWRDENIVKTVDNVSDVACKSIWWLLESYLNGLNNKKVKNGIKIMTLFPRCDKVQVQLMHKNRSKQDQPWEIFKLAKVLMTA